jgi:microcystin-dependent protein
MSSPFVAEIRIFPFFFAPKGWALCDGQLLPISQNTALFSLLGTQYGGDGKSNFALPNLQGSVALHTDQYSGGGSYPIGMQSGTPTVTLLQTEMPSHNHTVMAETAIFSTTQTQPAGNVPSNASPALIYSNTTQPDAKMSPLMVSTVGGSLPHNNMQPFVTLNYCIAMQGVYPPRG